MESSDVARMAAQRISDAANKKGLSVNKLMSLAGVGKSVVDRMKLGNMPAADKLSAIATVLDLPVDYLLGTGSFSNWDLILENRHAVLNDIAGMMSHLSLDLRNGVDDFTLAKLVSLFSVDVSEGSDPAGLEIVVLSPFATYAVTPRSSARPMDGEYTRRMVELYNQLSIEEQIMLIGRLQEMVSPLNGAKEKAGHAGLSTSTPPAVADDLTG